MTSPRRILPLALALLAAAACAAGEDDVATLNRSRTIVLEDVPACATDRAPASPSSGPAMEVGADALSLQVEFDNGSAHVSPSAGAQLERLARTLDDPALAGARFLIAGHTDASGGDAINLPLSCHRALAVREFLVSHGVGAERLQPQGFGARMPLAGTPPLSPANRRVEVRRLGAAVERP